MDHEQNNNTNGAVNNNLIANPFLAAADTGDVLTANSFIAAANTGDVSTTSPLIAADTGAEQGSNQGSNQEGEQVATDVVPDIGEEITLKIGKSTLVSLCQNLNTNLLVNIAAYKSVLAKLKDSENDEIKKTALASNIETLNKLESSVSALLTTVQTNLDIPDDKKIDPETVINEASSPNASSGNFMTKLLGAEAAAILGSMAAATVLMLGGGKYKRRKFTKGRRNKKQKSTKSNKT